MTTRPCPECGSMLPENAVFCTTCGSDLATLYTARRHRLLLFGAPMSLLLLGVVLAWEMGWDDPLNGGMDLGLAVCLFYIGGAVGQWLLARSLGRVAGMIDAWVGGLYAVILLPVALLAGLPAEQAFVGDGVAGITLADEAWLRLGIYFCIYTILLVAGLFGAAMRLASSPGPVPAGAAEMGAAAVDVLIRGVSPRPGSLGRVPGMVALVVGALVLTFAGYRSLPEPVRLVVAARLAALAGRGELALVLAGEAVAKDDRSAAAHHLRGQLELLRGRSVEGRAKALGDLRTAVRLAPDAARYHLTLGAELSRLGLASETARAASEAVGIHPGEPQLWMLLGDARMTLGERAGAVEAFRKAHAIDPQDPIAMNNLSFALLETNQELPFALDLARRSVAAQPGLVYNTDTLAWALYKNGRSNEALELLLQIREEIATPPAEIEFHTAVVLRELGLLPTPRLVFSKLLERPDTLVVPGLRDRIRGVLETLATDGAELVPGNVSPAVSAGEGR